MNSRMKVALPSVLMVAFGLIGIWECRSGSGGSSLPEKILVDGCLAFIALMGVVVWRRTVNRKVDLSVAASFLKAYSDAWEDLRSQKWLLRLIGSVALINVLGGVLAFGLERHYLYKMVSESLHGVVQRSPFSITQLPLALFHAIGDATNHVFPSVGLSDSTSVKLFAALTLLVILPSLLSSLRVIQVKPELQEAASRARARIVSLALALLIFSAGLLYLTCFTYLRMISAPLEPRLQNLLYLLGVICWIMQTAIITPALLSGLAGSLWRSNRGEAVSRDTFVADALRYWRPIAGLFLLFALISIPSYLFVSRLSQQAAYLGFLHLFFSTCYILLAFVPFAITTRGLTLREGLKQGIRDWRSTLGQSLPFFAFGLMIITFVRLIGSIITYLLPFLSAYDLIPVVFVNVLYTVLAIFMAVAMWEFYQQIMASSETIVDQ